MNTLSKPVWVVGSLLVSWMIGSLAVGQGPGTKLFQYGPTLPGVAPSEAGAGAGDVDADGTPDFMLRSPSNQVVVISGATGALLWVFNQPTGATGFGGSLASAGDVDLDGNDDVLVGAANAQRVYLYSGATGAQMRLWIGSSQSWRFGWNVASAGDANADGVPDVAIGMIHHSATGLSNAGRVEVYSGASNATLIRAYDGTSPNGTLGSSGDGNDDTIVSPGDVDGDGYDDLLIGAPEDWSPNSYGTGYARLHSGATGALLQSWTGQLLGDQFGRSVAAAGDLDLDGVPDVVIGAMQGLIIGGFGGPASGYATVYSGSTGSPLLTVTGQPTDGLGVYVVGLADINGDGVPEVGTSSFWSVTVRVHSGATGEVLRVWNPHPVPGVGRGQVLSNLGDVDGDGLEDLLATVRDPAGHSASVLSTLMPGPPVLATSAAIGTTVSFTLSSPYDALLPYACGFSAAAAPPILIGDGRRINLRWDPLLASSLAPSSTLFSNTMGTLDSAGSATVTANVPADPALIGASVVTAFVTTDPTASQGIASISPGTVVTIQ